MVAYKILVIDEWTLNYMKRYYDDYIYGDENHQLIYIYICNFRPKSLIKTKDNNFLTALFCYVKKKNFLSLSSKNECNRFYPGTFRFRFLKP